jgi:hypothetical protein
MKHIKKFGNIDRPAGHPTTHCFGRSKAVAPARTRSK